MIRKFIYLILIFITFSFFYSCSYYVNSILDEQNPPVYAPHRLKYSNVNVNLIKNGYYVTGFDISWEDVQDADYYYVNYEVYNDGTLDEGVIKATTGKPEDLGYITHKYKRSYSSYCSYDFSITPVKTYIDKKTGDLKEVKARKVNIYR